MKGSGGASPGPCSPTNRRFRRAPLLVIALILLLAFLPAGMLHADTKVVTFDDLFPGTVVSNQYQSSHGVYFLESDPGFLPVVRSVPGRARSGNNVVDISTCPPGCEFFTARTYGRLTVAARSITLYAGYLGSTGDAQVTLLARDAGGKQIDSYGPVTVTAGQAFNTLLRVATTSATADIAAFELYASNGALDTNEQIGFDDLTIELPDMTPPATTITSGPSGLTNDATPTFAFTSNEAGSTFECRVDTAAFSRCTSPHTTAALTEGAHTFAVRATDPGGNVDATPATRSFTVDTTPPQTTITAGPSGPISTSTPSFSFSSEAGATFQCRVDGAAFAACSSPHTTASLAQGAHTFEVRAIDAAGNADPTPAARSFTVDQSAPDTTIDSGPTGSTGDSTPTFGFSSPDAGSSFECRVDSAPFAPCSSPHTTATLADGPHTFEVRAKDAAGNADASPASSAFTVDTAPPESSITTGPSGPTDDPTPTFAFASSEPGSIFECRVDSAAFAPCSSPHTTAALAQGAHTFEVRAIDAAGNADPTPATRSFTVDQSAQAPGPLDTAIVSTPASFTRDRTPTFTFSSNQVGNSFECSLDDAPFSPCSSPYSAPTLRSGSHTFRVRARDQAGNVDPTPASFTFAIPAELADLPPPTVGKSFNAEPIGAGEVFVSVPAGSSSAPARASASVPGLKGRAFIPLREARQLPVGTFFDTRRGRVRLQSAADAKGSLQSGEFSAGVFQVLQSGKRAARGLTELRMKGASFRRCGSTRGRRAEVAARRSRRTIRRLRSNARGRFRTRGRYSAATVRGTAWTVADRCDGTLTTVSSGRVAVRDFRRRKTVLLRARKSYLARARR